jgi:hypothetical protein
LTIVQKEKEIVPQVPDGGDHEMVGRSVNKSGDDPKSQNRERGTEAEDQRRFQYHALHHGNFSMA